MMAIKSGDRQMRLDLTRRCYMSELPTELAENVVRGFREILSEAARENISDTHFEDLSLMIQDAIAEALSQAADRVADVAQTLRSEAGRRELEL